MRDYRFGASPLSSVAVLRYAKDGDACAEAGADADADVVVVVVVLLLLIPAVSQSMCIELQLSTRRRSRHKEAPLRPLALLTTGVTGISVVYSSSRVRSGDSRRLFVP